MNIIKFDGFKHNQLNSVQKLKKGALKSVNDCSCRKHPLKHHSFLTRNCWPQLLGIEEVDIAFNSKGHCAFDGIEEIKIALTPSSLTCQSLSRPTPSSGIQRG